MLADDLQKNRDVLKLNKLGSPTAAVALTPENCPTCVQPISDSLLSQSEIGEIMPIADSVECIKAQLGMLRQVAAQAKATAAQLEAKLGNVEEELRSASARLRALRTDLSV